jgi:FkbM family methyltransferase
MIQYFNFHSIGIKIKKKLETIMQVRIIRGSEFARITSELREIKNRESFQLLSRVQEADEGLDEDILRKIKDSLHLSSAQNLQDLIVGAVVGGNGFFVEFGAADGIELSNTFYLEKYLNWHGLLIEPDKYWKTDLKRNRKCQLDYRAVVPSSGSRKKFAFTSNTSPLHSKLADDGHVQVGIQRVHKVIGASLEEILKSRNAPKEIDLISMDVEGSELAILDSFNFKTFKVKFWIIEHNFRILEMEKIKKLMFSNGYKLLLEKFSGQDFYFIKANYNKIQ